MNNVPNGVSGTTLVKTHVPIPSHGAQLVNLSSNNIIGKYVQ